MYCLHLTTKSDEIDTEQGTDHRGVGLIICMMVHYHGIVYRIFHQLLLVGQYAQRFSCLTQFADVCAYQIRVQ